ncbi:unnamed protein product, partial [marine sediment metagenome]
KLANGVQQYDWGNQIRRYDEALAVAARLA